MWIRCVQGVCEGYADASRMQDMHSIWRACVGPVQGNMCGANVGYLWDIIAMCVGIVCGHRVWGIIVHAGACRETN